MAETHEAKPLDLGDRFAGVVALVNAEKQLIWQRYHMMLVINGIVLGVLSSNALIDDTAARLEISVAGLMLGVLWLRLNQEGCKYFKYYQRGAAHLWGKAPLMGNPFNPGLADFSPGAGKAPTNSWGGISDISNVTIYLFITAYITFVLISIQTIFL